MQVNEASASYLATAETQDVPPGYKRTDIGVIPRDWGTRRLGEIGHCLIGLTYRPSNVASDGLLVLRSSNIGDGNLQFEDNVFVNLQVPERLLVRADDLLICVRNGSRPLIGKCALIDQRATGMTFGAFMSVFRAPDNQFVFFCFQSDLVKRQIHEHLGATINQITNRSLNSFQIPFPQPKERGAIAGALSDVDGLIAALDKLIAKKRAIKQAAMQQLLTGKTRLPGFSGEWETRQLGELIELIPSGIYGVEKQVGSLTGMPVATTAHIDANDSWNDKEMDVRYFTEGQLARYLPREGDLIVVKSSGSAASIQSGKVGFVTRERASTFIFSNFLMLLRPVSCGARFLYFHLVSDRVKRMLPQLVEASTYPNIRINDYLEIAIPFPEKGEQTAIATVLSDMDAEIAALEARREKAKQIKQGMMQQLLTGRIRLVHQNRTS